MNTYIIYICIYTYIGMSVNCSFKPPPYLD